MNNKIISDDGLVSARVVLASEADWLDAKITTMELEYPRLIHSEFMTHRMFSRNSASSRAIPFNKMKEQLYARPVRFGEANKGMQDKGEEFEAPIYIRHNDYENHSFSPTEAWNYALDRALEVAEAFYNTGYHKQVYNRLLEPFQMMKVVVTSTEWNNFFWLRDHPAADPTIAALARVMKHAMDIAPPVKIHYDDVYSYIHLPYVEEDEKKSLAKEDQIICSVARCAAVSYRNENYTVEKCREIYDRLVKDDPKHASALEHVARPMSYYDTMYSNVGVTHEDGAGWRWSGNFREWIQHRQLIDGHVKPY